MKYGLATAGLICLLTPILDFIDPELVSKNGTYEPFDIYTVAILVLIGVLLLLLHLLIAPKTFHATVGNKDIILKKGSKEITINWTSVSSLRKYSFVPPIYSLKVHGDENVYLFPSQNSTISIGGFTKDLSEMGSLIDKKKAELNI